MIKGNESFKRITLVADIVAAYVSNHQMMPSDLPGSIQLIHQSLCNLEFSSPPLSTKCRASDISIDEFV